jgi:endogenous inhibitor of DNA gyrase (YacG/DUF329 family)
MQYSQVTKQCLACSKTFSVRKYREHTAKFCSNLCHKKLQFETARTIKTCPSCQNQFEDSPSRKARKFCSVECKNTERLSDKQRREKAKAAQILKRGNNSSRRLRNWIFKVKEAKCQSCGYDKRKYCIDLHHIDNNPNNNTVENIAILCVMCHRELHKGDLEHAAEKGLISKNDIV